ncbi:DUF6250 domain-containing protein [Gaoshiqia sp. Z1-71]|uniref:DUF6250 domain-containing protein n=1 Tax=Gaoshiqia hydrogeniformans TaxID=3290090 RepID=UPI003BF8F246
MRTAIGQIRKLTGMSAVVFSMVAAFPAACKYQEKGFTYEKDSLIFQDCFDSTLDHWVVEVDSAPGVTIEIRNGKLMIDVDRGATVWFNQKLSGNLLFEYKRKVIMDGGPNDRLSDMNQFWMAGDPRNPVLFTRKGAFAEYDSLRMYYAGIGGNYNNTTRFRKYNGNGGRILYHDLTDTTRLLKPNHTYLIEVMVYKGTTRVFVDNEEFFSFTDPDPIESGYFGIRTTWSRQEIDDFKVYRLK